MNWAPPDPDTLRRIAFQLRHRDWRLSSPASNDHGDGRWQATSGTTRLTADSLAALLDHLEWIHAT